MGTAEHYDGTLECVSGSMKIFAKSKVKIESKSSRMFIDNTLVIPGLPVNLFPLLKLEKRKFYTNIEKKNALQAKMDVLPVT